jgi:hypothetical protein
MIRFILNIYCTRIDNLLLTLGYRFLQHWLHPLKKHPKPNPNPNMQSTISRHLGSSSLHLMRARRTRALPWHHALLLATALSVAPPGTAAFSTTAPSSYYYEYQSLKRRRAPSLTPCRCRRRRPPLTMRQRTTMTMIPIPILVPANEF